MTALAAITAIVLVAFLGYLIYLVEFILTSRRDPFTDRVNGRAAQRARKVSGVYIRGHGRDGSAPDLSADNAPVVVGWGAPRAA
jgi:hypothetical protein